MRIHITGFSSMPGMVGGVDGLHVGQQVGLVDIALVAVLAPVRFVARVTVHVIYQ